MPSPGESDLSPFQVDLALVQAVGADIRNLVKRGLRRPITIAVQHASLQSHSQRTRLHQALAEMPSTASNLITVQVCLPREEFWTYECRSFVETCSSLGMKWSAQIALERPHAIPEGRSSLRSVGVSLSRGVRTESQSLRLLENFGARARTLGLECAAYGLASRALVLAAIGAGFRELSGPAIHADVASLTRAVRFEPLDLYRDIVPGDAKIASIP